jgi:hypothetical protein
MGCLASSQLTHDKDRFVWNLNTYGLFTIKSLYKNLMNSHNRFPTKYLWKLKIPLKLKSLCGS